MSRLVFLFLFTGTLVACGNADDLFPITGTLERERIELIAEASEPILDRPVTENQAVAAGDVIARLDDRRLGAVLAQAQAARDRARRRLDELIRGPRAQEILEARAALAGAEKDLEIQQAEFLRLQALARDQLASRSAADQQQAVRDRALATRDEAAARLDQLLEGTTVEELDQARASLAESEARLRKLEIDLERLTVRAPRAGHIDALPFEVGEQPPAGAVVAVMLSDAAPYVRLYVPAAIRARLSAGDPATIRLEGGRTLRGRVRYLATEAAFTPYFALNERDRSRLAYLAEVVVQDAPDDLPTGVPAVVTFDADDDRK